MDETYIRIRDEWRYLYRAVDKAGNTVDFLLRARRDKAAARAYFEKAIDQNGEPQTVTIDRSGSNLACLASDQRQAGSAEQGPPEKVSEQHCRQDHRAIKRQTRPMMGFRNFRCARIILGGIETMHMIRKSQMNDSGKALSPARQFYSLFA
ncbi:putative transposase [Paraburkholderia sp. Clong3]